MTDRKRSMLITGAALIGASSLLLAACSPASSDDDGGGGDATTVTFRLWDENAAAAYKKSFATFEEDHPDINVEIETVPWANYWERLPQDIGSGTMADIFWTNTSNFGLYADNGNLMNISDVIGDDHEEWTKSAVDLYMRNGSLWGVPQLTDSIALFYNVDMLEEAGIDPTELRWDPSGENDTFLPALLELTVDENGNTAAEEDFDPENIATYGFNAQNDLQAIYTDFLAENGAHYQDGDTFDFNTPEGVAAFQYLVDLINKYHVSPSAAETNQNGDLSRQLFVQGKMALFQSGQYSLPQVSEADFDWAIAPMVAGPKGRVGVVHSVAALGNADTEHPEATKEVLRWLGTAEAQKPLGATGAAFPAAVDAQDSFTDYWKSQGVDTSQFIKQAEGKTTPAPLGPKADAGSNALQPYFKQMFAGTMPVEEALAKAQEAANEAIED